MSPRAVCCPTGLNELEWVEGEIYANIWQTDRIARIDPKTGNVVGWIDLEGLLSKGDRIPDHTDVLNGIAYDAAKKRLFVTGKLWPKLFEIKLVRKKEAGRALRRADCAPSARRRGRRAPLGVDVGLHGSKSAFRRRRPGRSDL